MIQINVPPLKKLGILLSGRGSNFEAIADSIKAGRLQAEIAIVISNRADAPGLEWAKRRGLNAQLIPSKGRVREEHDAEVVAALKQAQVDLICLAGYMRLLSPDFVRAFPDQIVNIHPSLLPAFPGMDAQKQALDYGAKVTGCTVHFVDEHLDHGPIILQKTVPVLDSDDVHTLSARILEQEHSAYSEAISLVLSDELEVVDRRVLRKRGCSEARSLEAKSSEAKRSEER
jgi:phosphoribosylglycinamide formyltransferase 1